VEVVPLVVQHSHTLAAGMEVHRKDLVEEVHRDPVVGHRVERHRDPAVAHKVPVAGRKDLVEEAHRDLVEEAHRDLVVGRKDLAGDYHRVGYHNPS